MSSPSLNNSESSTTVITAMAALLANDSSAQVNTMSGKTIGDSDDVTSVASAVEQLTVYVKVMSGYSQLASKVASEVVDIAPSTNTLVMSLSE